MTHKQKNIDTSFELTLYDHGKKDGITTAPNVSIKSQSPSNAASKLLPALLLKF